MDKLEHIASQLQERLDKPFSPRFILDKFRLITEDTRQTAAFTDPLYIPFYYHLGCITKPETLMEIGFRLGLFSGAFLRSCKTVNNFLGFQEATEEYYSVRLGRSNIKSVYKHKYDIHIGKIEDDAFIEKVDSEKWDICILNEEVGYDKHMSYFDFAWQNLSFNGLIVMDYIDRHVPTSKAFKDFCKSKNREPTTFKTRYGVGIIQK